MRGRFRRPEVELGRRGMVSCLVMKVLEGRGGGRSTSGPGRPWSWALTLHGRDGFPYW